MNIIGTIVSVLFVLIALGCKAEPNKINLDESIRGDFTQEQWNSFDNVFKYESCLRYKIGEMRNLVSKVSSPMDLINYYPLWQERLEACDHLYAIDNVQAEKLRETVSVEMAKALGEETSSYLTIQRLYKNNSSEQEWIDKWRGFAIVNVADVENVLTNDKEE